ncbi:MAG: glycosyltransferase family 2 protein [Bdellovibrionales bacterium]
MSADSSFELSIVMPCLDEARTLPICIKKAQKFLIDHNVKGEILIADNGSTDGSVALAEEAGARVVRVEERGYGAALAGGIAAAKAPLIIMGDCDDSYDFEALLPMYEKLKAGIQLVVGNRFQGGIKRGAMPFLNHYLGNPVLSFIGRLFFKIPLRDFHCGLRGFSRDAILSLDLQTTGMEYASEMIVRAALQGLSVAEVPVTLSPDGRARPPHLQPWRDGWRHLRFLLLYSPRWVYFYPGLALVIFGLVLATMLLPGPLMIADGVGLDVHSLLVGATSIVVGTQTITFGLIARSYAQRNGILPSHSRYDVLIKNVRLEHLLLISALLLLCGLALAGVAIERWSAVNFGAIDYRDVMRLLICAVTSIVASLQLGFAGFLLGVMQIRQKE